MFETSFNINSLINTYDQNINVDNQQLLTVWNPASPRILHMLKKHMTHTIIDPGDSFNASTKALLPPRNKE